jgi:hypothetical protein
MLLNLGLGGGFAVLLTIDLLYYHIITADWRLLLFMIGLFGFFILAGSISGGLIKFRWPF